MYRLGRSEELTSNFISICKHYYRSSVEKTKNISIDKSEMFERPIEEQHETDVKHQKKESVEMKKVKKRNFAMLLSYLGKDYFGMQRNPGVDTVEEHLIQSMLRSGLINSNAFEAVQSINFQRAARTDKGVSAIRQVVSLKLPENPSKDIINKNLPDDIRVFGIKRVTRGFNSKSQCDARTYSYILPTFALAPENLELFKKAGEYIDIDKRIKELLIIDGKPYNEYRLPSELKQKLDNLLKLYEGSHNFHNFTSKILPLDPRARRFIISFVTEEPFIIDGMEFMTLKVKGQSFVLHQIRKMVALAIGVMRNIVSLKAFEKQAYEKEKYDISRAPSLGLMLDIVHYDYYNKRYGLDGIHEKLDWSDSEEEIKNFEKNVIVKHIVSTEIKEKSMLEWLANLSPRSFGPHDEGREQIQENINNTKKQE